MNTVPVQMPRRSGFTLLEIMLAVVIVSLIMMAAVPSISGIFQEQRLRRSFDALEDMARQAQSMAIAEHRTYYLQWDKDAITLRRDAPKEGEEEIVNTLAVEKGDKFDITFTAALSKKVSPDWCFWPAGTCEPATITYEGSGGTWTAQFDPLTGRGQILESNGR